MVCLSIPAQVTKVEGDRVEVESMGVLTWVDASLVTPLLPGDYVLVHAGQALIKINRDEAEENLRLWEEVCAYGRKP